MSEVFIIEEYAVALLVIATIVGIIARRLRMPYTVGLVIVGALLALVFPQVPFEVGHDVILGIFVPPLIFEAAFHLPFSEVRRNLSPILRLAIVGVLFTTLLVGGIVYTGAGLPVAYALIFGAIIAATDPVAVIALFRTLGVPKRLQVLLEGESLLNDGTAIVVFSIAVEAVTTTNGFSLRDGILEFLYSAGLGLGVGLLLGLAATFVISRIDDYLIETAITFVLAYGAFILGEMIHVSGVLAVVAAGLANGNIGPQGMSSTTRIVVFNFWDFMSFLANSFVFLLIGLVVDIPLMLDNWRAILWGILAALLARLIVVYGLFPRPTIIPLRWKHILYWGGLRGAISLALVLGLETIPFQFRSQLQAMVFGLVLFTLLIQGTTMSWLVQRMGIIHRREERDEYDLRRARVATTRAAYEHLKKIHREGMISKNVWETITGTIDAYSRELTDSMQDILKRHPEVRTEELDSAWREFLQYQRLALAQLLADRGITEDVFNELASRIDDQLASHQITWENKKSINADLWQIQDLSNDPDTKSS